MREKLYLILSALILGTLIYFLSGALFLLLVFAGVCYLIYKNTPITDRRFVIGVLVAAFAVRIALAVGLHAYFYTKGFHSISGDDLLYIVKSWALVYKWEGKPHIWEQVIVGSSSKYGMNPFTFILASFYKLFGFHPVLSKIINCMIGSLIGWASYLIGRRIFNSGAGKIAMVLVAFYPSLIRWSVANLKDPLIIFLFVTSIYIFIDSIYDRVALWKVSLLAMSMVALYFFSQIFYFVLLLVGLVIVILTRIYNLIGKGIFKKLFILLFIITLVSVALYVIYINPEPVIDVIYLCQETQLAVAMSDYAGYYFYPGNFMEKLSRGLIDLPSFLNITLVDTVYFMLAPFPWQMVSRSRILALPQVLFWYTLLLLAAFGFIRLLIKRPQVALLVGVIIFLGVTINSLAEGNVGSAFRHRDFYAPIIIVFASAIIEDIYLKIVSNKSKNMTM